MQTLKEGSSGSEVEKLQQRLKELGFNLRAAGKGRRSGS
jgi:hypothetical protein